MPYKNYEDTLAYSKKYAREHPERQRNYQKKLGWELKIKVLQYYSPNGIPECTHCGEKDIIVLCIDHINGDGGEERKKFNLHAGNRFYRFLAKNNFPEGYQVLCLNCNWRKRYKEHKLYQGGEL